MATPRSRYIRVSDLVLDEDWDDRMLATVVRLLAWMRRRWARERLTAEQASEAVISAREARRITNIGRDDRALHYLNILGTSAGLTSYVASMSSGHCSDVVSIKWPKVAEYQGWSAPSPGDGEPDTRPLRRPVSRRPDARRREDLKTDPHPASPGSAAVEVAWDRGREAGAEYLPAAARWKLNDARRRLIRTLLKEAPERGAEAFSQLVHGYIASHRRVTNGFDPMVYFRPSSLLVAEKRQERWEAYDAAITSGLSPPFSIVEVMPAKTESFAERQQREIDEHLRGKLSGRSGAPNGSHPQALHRLSARGDDEPDRPLPGADEDVLDL